MSWRNATTVLKAARTNLQACPRLTVRPALNTIRILRLSMLVPHSDFPTLSLFFYLQKLPQVTRSKQASQTVKLLKKFPGFSGQILWWVDVERLTAELSDHSREPSAGAACVSLKCSSFTVREKRMKEKWDCPISDSLCRSYRSTTFSARSQFVKKVKFFHLTNLNSVLRWILATRKSTIGFLSLLYQHWPFSCKDSHWASFYSHVWTTCVCY